MRQRDEQTIEREVMFYIKELHKYCLGHKVVEFAAALLEGCELYRKPGRHLKLVRLETKPEKK